MPIVHVHVARGRPSGERKAILDGVHEVQIQASARVRSLPGGSVRVDAFGCDRW